jgi:hypothetical protein
VPVLVIQELTVAEVLEMRSKRKRRARFLVPPPAAEAPEASGEAVGADDDRVEEGNDAA